MLRPMPIEPLPTATARVARAAFPTGNRYLRVADELETLFTDEAFLALFPTHGQPARPPWQLALVTIRPVAEGLADRQAANAGRSRIDWTYVLRLELAAPGFEASVLSECRTRRRVGAAEYLLVDTWLTWCRDHPLVKAGGRQRPDDAEAHDARQHPTPWVGSQVPSTATCEDEVPHLITRVDTTIGPAADGAAPPQIHAALPPRGLRPGSHRVDTGFLEAALRVERQAHDGVALLGPTRLDDRWQAREGAGFDAQHFQIDGDQHHATCPAGQTRRGWTAAVDHRGNPVIKGKFSTKDGRRCEQGAPCRRATKREPRRTRTIGPQPHYQALQAARQREATDAFRAAYARRAGIEGPSSRGTRRTRLRRTRYMGLTRVHLGHILTAVGLHVRRLGEWWLETARANTRLTPFARLMATAAAA